MTRLIPNPLHAATIPPNMSIVKLRKPKPGVGFALQEFSSGNMSPYSGQPQGVAPQPAPPKPPAPPPPLMAGGGMKPVSTGFTPGAGPGGIPSFTGGPSVTNASTNVSSPAALAPSGWSQVNGQFVYKPPAGATGGPTYTPGKFGMAGSWSNAGNTPPPPGYKWGPMMPDGRQQLVPI